jgi:hypothetical protein
MLCCSVVLESSLHAHDRVVLNVMEGLAALSVAAATLQLIGHGLKTLDLCRQIRSSEKGSTEANEAIEHHVGEIRKIQNTLEPGVVLRGASPHDADHITKAHRECDGIAQELLRMLQDLKPGQKHKHTESMRAAFRAHRARAKIDALHRRFDDCNTRLQSSFGISVRNQIVDLLQGHDKIEGILRGDLMPEVKNMRAEAAASHVTTHKELSSLQNNLTATHGSLKSEITTLNDGQRSAADRIISEQTGISGRIDSHFDGAQDKAAHKRFLDSLFFPDMFARQESIKLPSTDTYEWIFSGLSSDSHPVEEAHASRDLELRGRFREWLCGADPVFWVNGKAGSGKSSLMSFVEGDPRTRQGLSLCSGDRALHIFSFFFWRPGSQLQKSTAGLLRSLLYQMAQAKPSVILNMLSRDPNLQNMNWTATRLSNTIKEVIRAFATPDDCVFILIDGLDEFTGDYVELLDTIFKIRTIANAKICLSSRPDAVLSLRLGSYPFIRLQDLNFDDIAKFVKSKFATCGEPLINMTHAVAWRAEGIFLWAALVSQDLFAGYAAHDDMATLERRLEAIPSGLEALFSQLFSSLDRHHRELLFFVLQALKDLRTPNEDWVSQQYRPHVAVLTAALYHTQIKSLDDFHRLCSIVRHRITAQSKGLLEMREINQPSSWKSGIMGWAITDCSTHKPYTSALPDAHFRLAYQHQNTLVDWVHRSAYDYIFGTPDGNLPSRVQGIDVSSQILAGYAWLAKYALSIWVVGRPDQRPSYLESNFRFITQPVTNLMHSHSNQILGRGYETLDEIYELLVSSLSENTALRLMLSRHESLCGLHALTVPRPMQDFFHGLIQGEMTDYIVSRFTRLRSYLYAHHTCGTMLSAGLDAGDLNIVELALDHLLQETEKDMRDVTTLEFRCSCLLDIRGVGGEIVTSWLSRGKSDEACTMKDLKYAVNRVKWDGLLSDNGQSTSGRRKAEIATRILLLSQHWRLFDSHPKLASDGTLLALQIHLETHHDLLRHDPSTTQEAAACLRFICVQDEYKGPHSEVLENDSRGVLPLCTFNVSLALGTRLMSFILPQRSLGNVSTVVTFQGTVSEFTACLEMSTREIQADSDQSADPSQKQHLVRAMRESFRQFWDIRG